MKIKNVKSTGFTLIELLAVVVVLAIIMMIASTQVIPLISSVREDGFATNANTVIDVVSNATLSDEIRGKDYTCYEVSYLIEKGLLTKLDSSIYSGIVIIDKADYKHEYTIYFKDSKNNYCIDGYHHTGINNITRDNIDTVCPTTFTVPSCPNNTSPTQG